MTSLTVQQLSLSPKRANLSLNFVYIISGRVQQTSLSLSL